MAQKPVILEGGKAEREQWLSDVYFNDPEERRIERSAGVGYDVTPNGRGEPYIIMSHFIEVYIWTGEREPVIEKWVTRGGTEKQRTHDAPVFHYDHTREIHV